MTTAILVHLGLGSNLGNRLDFLNRACSELTAVTLRDFRASEIYESEPLLKMKQATDLFISLVSEDTFEEFLTIRAYDQLD